MLWLRAFVHWYKRPFFRDRIQNRRLHMKICRRRFSFLCGQVLDHCILQLHIRTALILIGIEDAVQHDLRTERRIILRIAVFTYQYKFQPLRTAGRRIPSAADRSKAASRFVSYDGSSFYAGSASYRQQ